MASNYTYRAYIKDQLALNELPKAYLTVRSGNIKEDLLTKATSFFKTLNLPKNINNGDILVVYENDGTAIYRGVITQYGDDNHKKGDKVIESFINTSQMQSFYKGEWIGNAIIAYSNTADDNKWSFEGYYVDDLKYPKLDEVEDLTEIATNTYTDNNMSISMNLGSHFYAKASTNVYSTYDITSSITFTTKGNASIYLNGVLIGKSENNVSKEIVCDFLAGWNKVDICFSLRTGNGGCLLNPKLSSLLEEMASSDETYTVDDSWIITTYDPFVDIVPTIDSFSSLTPSTTNTYLDSQISTSMNIGDYYYAKAYTHVYSTSDQIRSIKFTTNEAGSVYLNGTKIGETQALVQTGLRCIFNKGWNKIEIYYFNKTGNDGWTTSPKLSAIFSRMSSVGTPVLEQSIAETVDKFAKGFQKGSPFQDKLILQEKAPLVIITRSTTEGLLEPFKDMDIEDMEDYIYDMYLKYGVVFDFDIPYNSWAIGDEYGGTCNIFVPEYATIKVGDNSNYILDMAPTLEIEETNKIVVFSNDGIYRSTFIVDKNNQILEEPLDIEDRFEVTNTKIIYSDDDIESIKKSNLSENMYNHKITFKLLLDSKLYDYKSFKLGMPIDIWNGSDYYNSVLTGYEIEIKENERPTEIKLICGKVRTALTAKLNMRKGA